MNPRDSLDRPDESHRQNLRLQAEKHPLIRDKVFISWEEYVLHLIHIKAYEEAARLASGKSVLDWGCNVGYGMEILLSTASSVAGLDLAPEAVAAARGRLGAAASDIQVYDGYRCEFESDRFDVVTSFQVLEHVSDYQAYFSEMVRVLRPGGMAILTTPNAALRLEPGMKPWYRFHTREFRPAELEELLAAWFGSVQIRGLFAGDELYAIERNRVERVKHRALAALREGRIRSAVKAFVKRRLGWCLRVRDKLRSLTSPASRELDASQLARFSTNDLFYKDDQTEEALDLMAVCRSE